MKFTINLLFLLSLHTPLQRRNTHRFVAAAIPREDWSKLDLAALEEQWKTGDSDEDLATPDDELYRILEKKRNDAFDRMQSIMKPDWHEKADGSGGSDDGKRRAKELERAALDAQHAGKAAMVFATLRRDKAPKERKERNHDSDGSNWDWDSMAKVCDEWSVCSYRYFLWYLFISSA